MALEGVQRLRLVEREDTDVVVVAARGDEPPGVRFAGRDDAHAGNEIRVARHAVHLCEAFIWAGRRRGKR